METDTRASAPGLAVPVAVSDLGELVRPDQAKPGVDYTCPGCQAAVVCRSGDRRRPHFAHRGGEGCSSESVLHRAGKLRILYVIQAWKDGQGARPCVSRPCPRYGCDGGVVQDVPSDITHAAEEVRLPDGTIADVVLFRGMTPAVAIEVLVSHSVSPEKAARFQIPWMEVRAKDILDRPYWWVLAQDGLRPTVCPSCEKDDETRYGALGAIKDRAAFVAERMELSLPPIPPYKYVAHMCWRCGNEMVVFLWPGGGDHSARRPPGPIPSSVQHRVTEGWGDYWANCCPTCSAVQGDYYLSSGNEDYVKAQEIHEQVDAKDFW